MVIDEFFYGTPPQDTQDFSQVLRGVGRSIQDIGRGVSYYPYDLLGSGVDVANMGLGAIGLGSERPVLGSDYLRNIAQSLGLAQPSTGSGTETAARFASALINPAAGARAVGKVGSDINRLVSMIDETPPRGSVRIRDDVPPASVDDLVSQIEPQATTQGFNVVQPGDKVSGLTVRKDVPNMSSIAASFDDYEILSGIREVSRNAFDPEYLGSLSYEKLDKRTKDLAEQIKQSKEINPMIVGVDSKGAYIVEGGHRFDALMSQDTKSIPAVVVIDKSDPPADIKGLLSDAPENIKLVDSFLDKAQKFPSNYTDIAPKQSMVEIDQLIPTQQKVNQSAVDAYKSGQGSMGDLPVDVVFDTQTRQYLVVDGHHRVAAMIELGLDKVPVQIIGEK